MYGLLASVVAQVDKESACSARDRGPLVETLRSQCREHRFDPWPGN